MTSIYSCKKDKAVKMDFTISQQTDTTFSYEKLSRNIAIAYSTGDKTNVSLGINGLPMGLDAQFSAKSGTPDFSSSLDFTHNDYIIPGTYPIKITGNADDGTVKTSEFNLLVSKSCGEFASGIYNANVTYLSSGALLNNTQYRLAVKPENTNRIFFYEGSNKEADFYADVDCSSQTITIPLQTQNGSSLQFSGSGTMVTKTSQFDFIINYEGFTELKFAMSKL